MTKYVVSVTFTGKIEAKDAEDAWGKAYEGLSNACGEFETAMDEIGMTKVEHWHEEPMED